MDMAREGEELRLEMEAELRKEKEVRAHEEKMRIEEAKKREGAEKLLGEERKRRADMEKAVKEEVEKRGKAEVALAEEQKLRKNEEPKAKAEEKARKEWQSKFAEEEGRRALVEARLKEESERRAKAEAFAKTEQGIRKEEEKARKEEERMRGLAEARAVEESKKRAKAEVRALAEESRRGELEERLKQVMAQKSDDVAEAASEKDERIATLEGRLKEAEQARAQAELFVSEADRKRNLAETKGAQAHMLAAEKEKLRAESDARARAAEERRLDSTRKLETVMKASEEWQQRFVQAESERMALRSEVAKMSSILAGEREQAAATVARADAAEKALSVAKSELESERALSDALRLDVLSLQKHEANVTVTGTDSEEDAINKNRAGGTLEGVCETESKLPPAERRSSGENVIGALQAALRQARANGAAEAVKREKAEGRAKDLETRLVALEAAAAITISSSSSAAGDGCELSNSSASRDSRASSSAGTPLEEATDSLLRQIQGQLATLQMQLEETQAERTAAERQLLALQQEQQQQQLQQQQLQQVAQKALVALSERHVGEKVDSEGPEGGRISRESTHHHQQLLGHAEDAARVLRSGSVAGGEGESEREKQVSWGGAMAPRKASTGVKPGGQMQRLEAGLHSEKLKREAAEELLSEEVARRKDLENLVREAVRRQEEAEMKAAAMAATLADASANKAASGGGLSTTVAPLAAIDMMSFPQILAGVQTSVGPLKGAPPPNPPSILDRFRIRVPTAKVADAPGGA
eukprot:TRINITY_DN13922_c0_g5_i1.p1 TRINITY_DN13922_c0_g5~~TRINITY_DN13922_c0_g5_i1.p1  ORF type:complete len:889 (+),score=296.03 TRINITY_DN13922_c0_g5_i1:384-2669(+)